MLVFTHPKIIHVTTKQTCAHIYGRLLQCRLTYEHIVNTWCQHMIPNKPLRHAGKMFVIGRFGALGADGSVAKNANGGVGSSGSANRKSMRSGGGGAGGVGYHGKLVMIFSDFWRFVFSLRTNQSIHIPRCRWLSGGHMLTVLIIFFYDKPGKHGAHLAAGQQGMQLKSLL